ncbi:MAG: methionine gamma-lyase family protein [Clostridiales Family XIII bacterium]|jgi:cystathionine beta-lyase family protein involved in aluminum resistance|nr:methionine gamma-lyase family protein [Clostridiales Family XIII bacterium]
MTKTEENTREYLGGAETSKEYLERTFGIDGRVGDLISDCEKDAEQTFAETNEIRDYNQYKVLNAFRKNRISDVHFAWQTGYGYDDAGRAATERVYADVLGAESALVRPLIVNGTHALSLIFFGVLRPGDELVYCTGAPYDSLNAAIGLTDGGKGSLREFGIGYKQAELKADGGLDFDAIARAVGPATRMLALQRATGYSERKAVSTEEIRRWANFAKELSANAQKEGRKPIVSMVDNCYGEFLDKVEPTEIGADIMAGSLIKNPGGGLALSGGYVAGRRALVEMVADRMTCPGIGGECGLTFGQTRAILQGLFVAPNIVNGAIKGAILCARVFESLGFAVNPRFDDPRSDIIETIRMNSAEALIAFCEGIQDAAPVDSFAKPEPWAMPGYEDEIIMAAGAFVQGSSIELSADGPMRPPYNVYFQGGLSYEHAKLGVMKAVQTLLDRGMIDLR